MKTTAIILLIIGALLVLIGSLFKVMHWPDLFYGQISGSFILAIGIALLFIQHSRNNSNNISN